MQVTPAAYRPQAIDVLGVMMKWTWWGIGQRAQVCVPDARAARAIAIQDGTHLDQAGIQNP